MKLRLIIIVLALLSFLSTSVGGYLYYSSLKNAAVDESFYKADELIRDLASHTDLYIAGHKRTVKALAGLREVRSLVLDRDADSLEKAHAVLDHFRDALEVSVCYISDSAGNIVASSNRDAPDSFLGKNYSFRPYFREAMQGRPSVYMALGVTSKKRGAYFSYPVYGKDQDIPSGVVIIKALVDDISREINKSYEGIMMLTGPDDVIFISNRTDWVYKTLWRVEPERVFSIAGSRQFGEGPWDWIGMERSENGHAYDNSGKEYHIHQTGINSYPGWNIIYLHDHEEVLKKVAGPLFKTSGYTLLLLSVLIGLSVILLYKRAHYDILMRRKAEDALKKTLEMEAQFNRDLEPLVAERTLSLIALNVADKLRNPAAVIGLICKRLFRRMDNPHEIREGLSDIVRETKRLEEIVENYESILKSRKSMFQYDDINDVVREAVILIENEAADKGVALAVSLSEEPLDINLQKSLLRIAVFHLLSNAVDATAKNGSITVLTSRLDDKVIFEISDTGTGFKKEDLDRVFDPFFSTKQHSYGLGLPLVKHIVTEHLGEIDVKSEEGKGTTFRLTFPVRWVRRTGNHFS